MGSYPAPERGHKTMPQFTHLHVHSNYSLQEGAAYVDDLAQSAARMGMDSLALTDHDGMYGAVRFTVACRQAGVRPILGAEIEYGEGFHTVLLAKDAIGWSNLCRLVTQMHLGETKRDARARPRTTFESIANHSEGLIALSGCARGEVPWYASLGRSDEAATAARRFVDVFGTQRFAIEVSNHLLAQDPLRIRRLRDIARDLGLRTVATNNVHYVGPHDAVLHDLADCMRRLVALTPSSAPRSNNEYWLKSPSMMAQLHDPAAIEGAAWVAEQCAFEFDLGSFHFPDIENVDGDSSTSVLARQCWEGARRRYPIISQAVEERLQTELRMIRRGGFCGYFVLVADIVDHARNDLGIRAACRGSAASSLVAYLLGISEVDPIRYDLVFERFMNEHRREIPDIDVDFESARREEMNAYILGRYPGRTAMAGMMDTYRARGALREVGKALGIDGSEVDLICKTFPHISARAIPAALEALPEVTEMGLRSSKLDMLFELASRIDAYPRHLAMHPSGVILSDSKLADLMPMQLSFNGFLMSQFDKDDIETLGLAKLDVLGVRMFSTIRYTLDEIERVQGVKVDIDSVPREDEETFELIRDSRTMGCFQIESPGQRELLGKFQPECFEDLIIDISLFRPGPMKADMIKPFLNRRMGLEPVTYLNKLLVPILRESNGVVVYHEQVMRVIAALTGCTLGEADKIRRSLDGDKHDEGEHPLTAWVIERAVGRGWDEPCARKVWSEALSFASFGFCKAHAAAFAVPTYQSAWLKAHHPAEFYCGVLTHDPGMYPRRAILADARAHGVAVLPVDVNRSDRTYRVEDGGIRLALQDVSGISSDEIERIISSRPLRSLGEMIRRTSVSRPVVEALVHCGALDSIKGKRSRRELMWEAWSSESVQPEQSTLAIFDPEQIRLPGISDYSAAESVKAELEVTGMDASRHLISLYLDKLKGLGWLPASRLRSQRSNARVTVAGVKVATQTPPTRSGKRVIFLTLEDGTGQADVALFEEAQGRYARTVFDGWILAVRGTVRRTGAKGVSILAEEVIDLTDGKMIEDVSKVWFASGGSAGR